MAADRNGVDLEAMRRYRLDRVRAQLKARDIAGIVLYDPLNIRYATDTSNMQVWTMHNPARYCFIATEGPVVLFDFHNCEHLSADFELVDEVRNEVPWFYFIVGDRVAERARVWAQEIADLVAAHGGGNRRLAIDKCDPDGIAALRDLQIIPTEGQAVMELARYIKSPDELNAMAASLRTAERAVAKMRERLRPGMTENELWSHLHQVNIAEGGEWIETRLLSSGPRTNPWFQECSDRVIEAGDMVSFDTDLIGPYGYCSDFSRAWVCGRDRGTDEQRALHAIALEQVERGIELVRPGLSFKEFGAKAGDLLPPAYRRNRYSTVCHGVGLCDEFPHCAYPEDLENEGTNGHFQPGATVSMESYVGAEGGAEGIKLEQQILITETGVEILSQAPFGDELL